jgi:type IV secretory pathway TraG/TraD family ATPase VirD4
MPFSQTFNNAKKLLSSFSGESFRLRARRLDARFNLPRPALEQHLSSPAALLRLLQYAGKTFLSALAALAALVIGFLAIRDAQLSGELNLTLGLILIVAAGGAVASDFHDVEFAYSPRARQETYGSAFWATPADIKSLLFPSFDAALPAAVPIARFGRRWLALPIETARSGVAFLAKPGSGKTATFVMTLIRAWSRMSGGVFCLDVKGEIHAATAHYFPDVNVINLLDPDRSDAVDIIGACRDLSVAQQISALICKGQQSEGDNRFFSQAAAQLIKCALLGLPYLTEQFPRPVLADLYSLLAGNDASGKTTNFNALFLERGDKPLEVHRLICDSWGAYRELDPKTAGSIKITALTMLNEFRTPEVERVFSLPTPEEAAAGRRVVNFADLRRSGTAIYVVVSTQQAERLPNVLGVLFGLAEETLILTEGGTVACVYDEAGNIKLPDPSAFVGICRGKNVAPFFFFQNKEQVAKFYGRDYAASFWESIATKIFLPGLEGESAKYCTELCGTATVLESRLTDAPGTRNDSRHERQTRRNLIEPDEVRQMEPFEQCVVVSKSHPPIRAAFPPRGDLVDGQRSEMPVLTPQTLDDILHEMRRAIGAPSSVPLPSSPSEAFAYDESDELFDALNAVGRPPESLIEIGDFTQD